MKKFILVCPKTAVAYNEVFRLFKNAAVCFGYTRPNFEGLEGLCRWLTSFHVPHPVLTPHDKIGVTRYLKMERC